MPKNLSDQFHNEAIIHRTDLLRLAEDSRQKVLSFLGDLQSDLRKQIGEIDLFGTPLSAKGRKAESLIRQSQQTIDTAYGKMGQSLGKDLRELAQVEGRYAYRNLNDVMKGKVATTTLSSTELEELVSKSWIIGSPAKDWWAKQSADSQQRFAQQVRLGYAQGQTNDQIVERIIGGKTGRKIAVIDPKTGKSYLIDEYSKGVLDVSYRDASALVRTAVQTLSNNILYWTYLGNEDVLRGVQWLSTLDSRTTPLCRVRDGSAWGFDGNPLPGSKLQIPFPGPPPAHWQCRSVLIPLTKSWNQLIHEAHGEKAAVADEEAKTRLDSTPGTDSQKNVAAAPLPVQRVDLGKGGTNVTKRLARTTEPVDVVPADLRLSDTQLDYSRVSALIDSNQRDGVLAVRAEGKIIVISGQEKVAAAVLQNEPKIAVKVVDLPPNGRLLGSEIPAPKTPQPVSGLAPKVSENPLPVSTRASMDGQVASTLNYETWLKEKSNAFQDEVLGPTKANLFRKNLLTLSDMVDQSGKPLTLSELNVKLFPDVFAKGLSEDGWKVYSRGEMVRVAGKLGLTAAETRIFLVSLNIKPPASSSLYYNLIRGEENDGVPPLASEDSQMVQQIVNRIRSNPL